MVMKEKRKEHGEKIKKFKEQKQEQEMMDVQIQKKNDDEVSSRKAKINGKDSK